MKNKIILALIIAALSLSFACAKKEKPEVKNNINNIKKEELIKILNQD